MYGRLSLRSVTRNAVTVVPEKNYRCTQLTTSSDAHRQHHTQTCAHSALDVTETDITPHTDHTETCCFAPSIRFDMAGRRLLVVLERSSCSRSTARAKIGPSRKCCCRKKIIYVCVSCIHVLKLPQVAEQLLLVLLVVVVALVLVPAVGLCAANI